MIHENYRFSFFLILGAMAEDNLTLLVKKRHPILNAENFKTLHRLFSKWFSIPYPGPFEYLNIHMHKNEVVPFHFILDFKFFIQGKVYSDKIDFQTAPLKT